MVNAEQEREQIALPKEMKLKGKICNCFSLCVGVSWRFLPSWGYVDFHFYSCKV